MREPTLQSVGLTSTCLMHQMLLQLCIQCCDMNIWTQKLLCSAFSAHDNITLTVGHDARKLMLPFLTTHQVGRLIMETACGFLGLISINNSLRLDACLAHRNFDQRVAICQHITICDPSTTLKLQCLWELQVLDPRDSMPPCAEFWWNPQCGGSQWCEGACVQRPTLAIVLGLFGG